MKKNIDNWIYELPIAHRGLHNEVFPENTEGAFLNAISHGYAIETDIQMTLDGVLVCYHDDNLKRGLNIDKDIRTLSFSEIKDLKPFNGEYNIMTFSEFLSLVDGQVPLMLEIKNQKNKGIEEKVVSELKGYTGKFAIQSFNPFIIKNISKLAPEITVGVLHSREHVNYISKFSNWFLKNLVCRFIMKFDFLSVRAEDLAFYKNKYKKLNVITWTINSEDKLKIAEKFAKNIIFELPLSNLGKFEK
ncbi:MAG: hypothetical protein J6Q58_00975 [Clostridia bacterium]|nr:hypothetical protein [Clostridia bacterium]